MEKKKYESINKALSVFLEPLGPVMVASSSTDWVATGRVLILNVFQIQHNFKNNSRLKIKNNVYLMIIY